MLYELSPPNWNAYVNNPQVENGNLVFRSINDGGWQGVLRHGVGIYQLPQYNPGDTLQWALLARTTTSPAVLDLVVAGGGSINNLAYYGLTIGSDWGWITTPPTVIDRYVPTLLLGIPELGKEVQVKTWLLGDPDSIAQAISPSTPPGAVIKGFPWGKALIATAAVLGIAWVAKKKR